MLNRNQNTLNLTNPISVENIAVRHWAIYKITNPNGRVYIGKTHNLKKRISSYKCNAGSKGRIITRSAIKYGFDNHLFEVIDSFESDTAYASGKEIFWIRTYLSNVDKYPEHNGMNVTDGGEGSPGYRHRGESIAKMRNRKGKFNHSEESKKKISIGHLGRPKEKNRGKSRSAEFKLNISQKAKGHKRNVGRKHTPQSIANMCAAQKLNFKNQDAELRQKRIDRMTITKRAQMGIPILMFSLNGEYVMEHPSVNAAAKHLGIYMGGIYRCIIGKQKKSGGFIFKRK